MARRASSAVSGSREPLAGAGFRLIWTGCRVSDMEREPTDAAPTDPNAGRTARRPRPV